METKNFIWITFLGSCISFGHTYFSANERYNFGLLQGNSDGERLGARYNRSSVQVTSRSKLKFQLYRAPTPLPHCYSPEDLPSVGPKKMGKKSSRSQDGQVPENHRNWKNLDHRSCGFSVNDRIIGGKPAGLGKYPWMARVGRQLGSHYNQLFFVCGGTILNRFFVLTAAHCFMGKHSIPTLVRVGEYDVRSDVDCSHSFCASPFQDINILKYYTPRYFNPSTIENDITLLELATPIKFTETILPICLPPYSVSSSNLIGKRTEVAGWGVSNIYTKETPPVLLTVSLKVIDNAWCKMYRKRHRNFPFNIICAGYVVGKDSCTGDSGGPLMVPVRTRGRIRYFVIGIVSYGPQECGETNSPGVYTYVPQYEKWLLDIIDKK